MRKRPPHGKAEEPITADRLRELLRTKVLGGALNMPGDAELVDFARILEAWRRIGADEQNWAEFHELQRRAQAQLDSLADTVGQIENVNNAWRQIVYDGLLCGRDQPADRATERVLASRLHEVAEARELIERLRRLSVFTPNSDRWMGLGWKSLGEKLAQRFVDAMRPANPDFEPGYGHAGPVARFVAAIAPFLTGEHPTPASVATHLKACRKARQNGEI
jgi:hypothetical protein